MCRFKSGIILKDRVFIPEYDHHTNMLEELKIEDTYDNAKRLFVRAELIPKNNDVFSPVEEWEFVVDQDILPEWFVAEYEKQRMIAAVKEWAKTHIHIGKDNLVISEGQSHYIKDCQNVNVCDSATVEYICGSATVEYICGSATVKNIYDSATVKNIYDSATVKNIYGSATVEKSGGNAVIITSPYIKWRGQEKLLLLENSTLKDNYGHVIYQSGDFKLVSVSNESVEEG